MGILRIVLGVAVVFGCLYLMLMRNTRVRPPTVEGVGATTGAEHMKQQFEKAAQKEEAAGDEVQKKLDDAVQGK